MADLYPVPGPLPDRGYHVVVAAIAAIIVSTVAVILRCVSRGLAKAGFWWDDWIILISLVKNNPFLAQSRCTDDLDIAIHLGPYRLSDRLGVRRLRDTQMVTWCGTCHRF